MKKTPDKRIIRIMSIYRRLLSGQHLYLPKLADEFSVDIRSIQRDMADLQEMHVPIETPIIGGLKHHKLIHDAVKYSINFSIADIIVTTMAIHMLQQYKGSGLVAYVQEHAQKINETLNQHMSKEKQILQSKMYSHHTHNRDYKKHSDSMNEILSALLKQNKMEIKYHAVGSKPKKRIVHPYTLMTYKSGLYLIAMIENSKYAQEGSPTTFSLDRILSAKRLKEKFEVLEGWNPESCFSEYGIMPGEETEIEISFKARLEPYLKSLSWPENTSFRKTKNARLLIKSNIYINEEYVNWIIGFGTGAKVIAPASLVKEIHDRLKDNLRQYQ